MQAPQQIVVLAIGAGKERGEMGEPRALEVPGRAYLAKRSDIGRADAIDAHLVEFADVAPVRNGEGQDVPEREAEKIHEYLAPRRRSPLSGIHARQQPLDVLGAGVEVDLGGQAVYQGR